MIIKDIFLLLRLYQWVKNLFIFAPLFFSFSYNLKNFLTVLLGFVLFSFVASSIYIFNDYHDIEEDRNHPVKKNRPLASGRISKTFALFLMAILLIPSLIGAYILNFNFFIILLIYLFMNILYTLWLKHIPILDISIIAIGFVLRIFAGAALIDVPISMWIVIVTFLLAMFLALAKRRDDCILALNGNKVRKNICGYNLEMINTSMSIMAGVTIVAYLMYTVSEEVINKFGTDKLYFTAFFVVLGILRYLQISLVELNSGSPSKLIYKDRFLQLTILAWLISFYILVKVV